MRKGHWKVTLLDGSVNDDERVDDLTVEDGIIKLYNKGGFGSPFLLYIIPIAMLANAKWIEDE